MTESSEVYSFFDYDKEATRAIQEYYVPFFKGRKRVLDIACGRGEFLELLKEAGVGASGVDLDEAACRDGVAAGFTVTKEDVFTFLEHAGPGEYDGIFISHFLEHLPYDRIEELFRLCERVLEKDGVLVAAVPSVSSIGMHLEWFYRDPTHVGWRHPRTLAFYLVKAGLNIETIGNNPNTTTPYLGEPLGKVKTLEASLTANQAGLATLGRQMAEWAGGPPGYFSRVIRLLSGRRGIERQMTLVRQDYVDQLHNVNNSLLEMSGAIGDLIGRLDASFEDYIVSRKGPAGNA